MGTEAGLYVGLMSGTSVDAIDSALVRCSTGHTELLATREHKISEPLRHRIAELSHSGPDEIERMGILDRELGHLFGQATLDLLRTAGVPATDVRAIGSHGQTIRHRPPSGGSAPEQSFTLQIADPNTIAERTGITTVADFRRRDMAAGGEGAPLAPAFHAANFGAPGVNRAIINIGGIANATLLEGNTLVAGFDSGPGNTLMDHWILRHRSEPFDRDGLWAASGQPAPVLLEQLSRHPYFNKSGPRSTGKEAFNLGWLDTQLEAAGAFANEDIQATLAELTAHSIAQAISSTALKIDEAYICGGGAHNTYLMARLREHLSAKVLDTTEALGLAPDWVEAATFAWLAYCSLSDIHGNAPVVTGASGERILGGIYPG